MTAKKAASGAKKRVTKEPSYTATLQIGGRSYAATGDSVSEAIAALDPGKNARRPAILTLSDGFQAVDRLLTTFQVTRLFHPSPTSRTMYQKLISSLFDL